MGEDVEHWLEILREEMLNVCICVIYTHTHISTHACIYTCIFTYTHKIVTPYGLSAALQKRETGKF